jgi:bisphosphoglycerate-dependent phosphoglycerate mutase
MITTGSGYEKCIELVRMILSNSSDGVRELIKRTKEDVSNEVNWNENQISTWRKDFHVILPQVEFIDEQIKKSSESYDSFAEVRELLDSSEEDEEESDEIEDDEDIFKETEEVKD